MPARIADARDAAFLATWKALHDWPAQGDDLGVTGTQITAEIERHRSADTIAGWWHAIELSLFTARDAELADLLRIVMTRDVVPKYPFASLWHVSVSPVLDARMAALRTLLAQQDAPEVIVRRQFTGFEAGKALMNSSSLGFEAYVPALMALAPFLLGMAVPRIGGPIIFLFGTPQPGLSHRPGHDLLELYRAPMMSSDTRLPGRPVTISTWATEAFFKWWIERLNLLFGQLLDPVEFARPDRTYDVARHLAAVLSVERVFLCASSR